MYSLPKLYSEAIEITEDDASPIIGNSSSAFKFVAIRMQKSILIIFNLTLAILFLFKETGYYIK